MIRHSTDSIKAGMIANANSYQYYIAGFFDHSQADEYPGWVVSTEQTLNTLRTLQYPIKQLKVLEDLAVDLALIIERWLPPEACIYSLGHGLTSIDKGIVTCRWGVFCDQLEFTIYTLSIDGDERYLTIEKSEKLR